MSPYQPAGLSLGQAGAFAVRLFTATDRVEHLRSLWETLNWHPNAQIDFFNFVNESRASARPHVFLLEQHGKPHGLAVGRMAQTPYHCRLGYGSLPLGTARELSIVYGGPLNCDDPKAAEALVNGLLALLRARKADVVLLSHLDTRSQLFQLTTQQPARLCRDHLAAPQLHWRAHVPATSSEFLQRLGKKHRYWVRRLEKRLHEDFPGQVSYCRLSNPTNLGQLVQDLETVASKTYQRRLGAGFRADAEHKRRITFEAEKGWLRGSILYLGGRPCAFWMGVVYRNVFYSAFTGYDPDFRKYEAGTLLLMNIVEQLCEERVGTIDFGLGDALYKQRFGDQSWPEASVRVFSPSLRGLTLNCALTAVEAPALALQRILQRANLQQSIKTFWRKRLLNRARQPS